MVRKLAFRPSSFCQHEVTAGLMGGTKTPSRDEQAKALTLVVHSLEHSRSLGRGSAWHPLMYHSQTHTCKKNERKRWPRERKATVKFKNLTLKTWRFYLRT